MRGGKLQRLLRVLRVGLLCCYFALLADHIPGYYLWACGLFPGISLGFRVAAFGLEFTCWIWVHFLELVFNTGLVASALFGFGTGAILFVTMQSSPLFGVQHKAWIDNLLVFTYYQQPEKFSYYITNFILSKWRSLQVPGQNRNMGRGRNQISEHELQLLHQVLSIKQYKSTEIDLGAKFGVTATTFSQQPANTHQHEYLVPSLFQLQSLFGLVEIVDSSPLLRISARKLVFAAVGGFSLMLLTTVLQVAFFCRGTYVNWLTPVTTLLMLAIPIATYGSNLLIMAYLSSYLGKNLPDLKDRWLEILSPEEPADRSKFLDDVRFDPKLYQDMMGFGIDIVMQINTQQHPITNFLAQREIRECGIHHTVCFFSTILGQTAVSYFISCCWRGGL